VFLSFSLSLSIYIYMCVYIYTSLTFRHAVQVITHIKARRPASSVYAVGWSMGGCMLMRHMADAAEECELDGAMAVSPALDVGAVFHYFTGEALLSVCGRCLFGCCSRRVRVCVSLSGVLFSVGVCV